jgi:hypothetical protein
VTPTLAERARAWVEEHSVHGPTHVNLCSYCSDHYGGLAGISFPCEPFLEEVESLTELLRAVEVGA